MPIEPRGNSPVLAKRILVIALLVGGTFAIFDSAIRLYLQYRHDMGTLGHQVQHLLASHRTSLSMSLYRLDENQLHAELKDLLGHLGLMRLEVYEPGSGMPIQVQVGESAQKPTLHWQDTLWVEENGLRRNLGYLEVEIDASWPLKELRRGAFMALLGHSASLLILALIVLGITHFGITRHLISMARQLEAVNFDALAQRIHLKKKSSRPRDEIDRLGDAINALLQRLEDGRLQNEVQEAKRVELQKRHESGRKLEALGNLSGGIAHDINNILGIILLQTEMAVNQAGSNPAVLDRLGVVLKAVDRAKEVVRQILVFSRNSEGRLSAMNISHAVEEAMLLLKTTLPSKVTLITDIEPDCGILEAEPADIQQVLLNLGVNAFQAMEESGGTLNLSLKKIRIDAGEMPHLPEAKPGLYGLLTMTDTGPGMPKSVADRIFEPYFTTKEIGKGTGLGMAVVHGIISKLRGHILLHTRIGRGTTFRILLPIQPGQVGETSAVKPRPRGKGEHLLLAEDEPLLRSAMQETLQGLGYRVTACENGKQALELLQARPDSFAALVSDLSMPTMGGSELVEVARKVRPDLPIAICTGFARPGESEQLADQGIPLITGKPFLTSELAVAIQDLLAADAVSVYRPSSPG